ncbi:SAM-dependent methyltransferase [Streptomyces sp. NPDC002523]
MTPKKAFDDRLEWIFARFFGESIHFGYWDDGDDTTSIADAQDRLTDLLIAEVPLGPGQALLDVGCGTGRPAVRLALATGATVTGVTISASQVERATERAVAAGVAERVRFERHSAEALPHPDESFDAAWAVQSLCHIKDRSAALAEVRRVLRPGARFVVFDATKPADQGDGVGENEAEKNTVEKKTSTDFISPSVPDQHGYLELVTRAGFTVGAHRDVSTATRPTLRRFADQLGEHEEEMVERFGAAYANKVVQGISAMADVQDAKRLGSLVLTATRP